MGSTCSIDTFQGHQESTFEIDIKFTSLDSITLRTQNDISDIKMGYDLWTMKIRASVPATIRAHYTLSVSCLWEANVGQTLTDVNWTTIGNFRGFPNKLLSGAMYKRCISLWCSCCMTPRTYLVDQRYRLATETSAYCVTLDFLNNFYPSMPQGSSCALTHTEK